MANIFETARAERAYNKYVKGLESMAGLVETLSRPPCSRTLANWPRCSSTT